MNLFIQKIIFLQRAEIEGNKQKWNEKFSVELLASFPLGPGCRIIGDVPQTNNALWAGGDRSNHCWSAWLCVMSVAGRELVLPQSHTLDARAHLERVAVLRGLTLYAFGMSVSPLAILLHSGRQLGLAFVAIPSKLALLATHIQWYCLACAEKLTEST